MRATLILVFLFSGLVGKSQSTHFPKGHPAYHIYDRLDIKSKSHSLLHTSSKQYSRKKLIEEINTLGNPSQVFEYKETGGKTFTVNSFNLNPSNFIIKSGGEVLEENIDYSFDPGLGNVYINANYPIKDGEELSIYYDKTLFQDSYTKQDQADINYLMDDNIEWSKKKLIQRKRKKEF